MPSSAEDLMAQQTDGANRQAAAQAIETPASSKAVSAAKRRSSVQRRSKTPAEPSSTRSRIRSSHGRSSCFRGVTQHRRTKKWEAHIWDDHRQIYLGGFESEEDAARAHDIMALKCRGEDGLTNYSQDKYAALLPELDKVSKEEVRKLIMGRRLPSAPHNDSPVKAKGRKGATHHGTSRDSEHSFLGLLNAEEDDTLAVSSLAVAAAPPHKGPGIESQKCTDDTRLLQNAPIGSPLTLLMGLANPHHEPCIPFNEPPQNPLLDSFSSHNVASESHTTPFSSNQPAQFRDPSHEHFPCTIPFSPSHKLTSDMATFQTKGTANDSSMNHDLAVGHGNGYILPIPDVSRFQCTGHSQESPRPQGHSWDHLRNCPPSMYNANRQTGFWHAQDTELNVEKPDTVDPDMAAAYHQCLDDSVHSSATAAYAATGLFAQQMHANLQTDMHQLHHPSLLHDTEQLQAASPHLAARRHATAIGTQSPQAQRYMLGSSQCTSPRQTGMTSWQSAGSPPMIPSEAEPKTQSVPSRLQYLAHPDNAWRYADHLLPLKHSMVANSPMWWPAKASLAGEGSSPQLKPLFLSSFDT